MTTNVPHIYSKHVPWSGLWLLTNIVDDPQLDRGLCRPWIGYRIILLLVGYVFNSTMRLRASPGRMDEDPAGSVG